MFQNVRVVLWSCGRCHGPYKRRTSWHVYESNERFSSLLKILSNVNTKEQRETNEYRKSNINLSYLLKNITVIGRSQQKGEKQQLKKVEPQVAAVKLSYLLKKHLLFPITTKTGKTAIEGGATSRSSQSSKVGYGASKPSRSQAFISIKHLCYRLITTKTGKTAIKERWSHKSQQSIQQSWCFWQHQHRVAAVNLAKLVFLGQHQHQVAKRDHKCTISGTCYDQTKYYCSTQFVSGRCSAASTESVVPDGRH